MKKIYLTFEVSNLLDITRIGYVKETRPSCKEKGMVAET